MSPADLPEWLAKYREMSSQDRQRFHAQSALAYMEQVYSNSKNPVHAWDGYLEARRAGDPIPDWILDYFDRVGSTISRAARKHRKAVRPMGDFLAEALEFRESGRKGAVNRLQEIAKEGHEIEVASEFFFVLLEDPDAQMLALKTITAERHLARCSECDGLSPNTVENYWRKHMHLFEGWMTERFQKGRD